MNWYSCFRKTISKWKFDQLDTNRNQFLSRKELRVLKKRIKKVVRPKSCAKDIDTHCDLDGDKVVSFPEWKLCLGITRSKKRSRNNNNNRKEDSGAKVTSQSTESIMSLFDDVMSDDQSEDFEAEAEPEGKFNAPMLRDSGETTFDCARERKMAEELDRLNPSSHVFIPECLTSGHFASAQCHEVTGYCWCVNDVTGRPIPGTSTQHVLPDCEHVSRKSRSHPDQGTNFRTFPIPT